MHAGPPQPAYLRIQPALSHAQLQLAQLGQLSQPVQQAGVEGEGARAAPRKVQARQVRQRGQRGHPAGGAALVRVRADGQHGQA